MTRQTKPVTIGAMATLGDATNHNADGSNSPSSPRGVLHVAVVMGEASGCSLVAPASTFTEWRLRSWGLYGTGDDPRVLAHLTNATEPQFLEELDGGAEEEAALCLSPQRGLRDRLDSTAAGVGDLVERTRQRGASDTLSAVTSVHEDARDAPLGGERRVLGVRSRVLEVKAVRRTVLTPTLGKAILIDDE